MTKKSLMPFPKSQLIFSPREFKGSRLRCLQLTSLSNAKVAEFLQALIYPHAQIDEEAIWMPGGMLAPGEPELGRATASFSNETSKRNRPEDKAEDETASAHDERFRL